MKITIHRGSNQIGGCVTEYELNGWKLFVDFGNQLPGAPISREPLEIDGLTCGNLTKSALLITHYHGDHIGNLAEIDSSIPIFMGHTACDIFCKLQNRLSFIHGEVGEKAKKLLTRCQRANTFLEGEKLSFGPFIIEPIKMDHSAYDAYGFLIYNMGNHSESVFHTGDFRFHGSLGLNGIDTIKKLPKLKAFICEGTNIERNFKIAVTECEIEKRFECLFKRNKYNIVFVSSTNIDRLFGIYRAAKNSCRPIFMDGYQLDILNSVIEENKQFSDNDKTPKQALYDFDKKTPYILSYDRFSKNTPQFFIPGKMRRLINWKGCVLIARTTTSFVSLIKTFPENQIKKYLSMWIGYLNPDSPAYNDELAKALGSAYEYVHTSGHVDNNTLKDIFKTISTEMIIPMHTTNPRKFIEEMPEYECKIRIIEDKETIEI